MESHGICVGVSDHLPENIQLLGNFIDISCVLLRELLQHMGGLGFRLLILLSSLIIEIFSTNRGVKGFRAIGETVAVGRDHIGGSLLENVQVDTKGLHLIGGVVGTKRLEVIGKRYLGSIELVYSLFDISYLEGTSHLASSLENIFDHVLASAPHLVTLL